MNQSNDEFISYKTIMNTIVIYNIIIATFMQNYGHAIEFPQKGKVPAFLVFGDSIVDSGNNNYIATIGRANFPPYGRDFPGGVATGRFSNGKVPSDFIVEELGIKEFVPPYLDPKVNISDLLTGVSFAFGAAGYDPESAKSSNVLTLEDQLNLFKGYIKKLKAAVGENITSTIISQSVYLVCAGSNDITNTYFSVVPFERLRYDVSTYTSMMVNWASSFVQQLYDLGARRIGVISAPPCGCLPSQRTLHGGPLRSCFEDENEASILFNNKLFSELNHLNQKLTGSRFVYLDIYNPILNLINNPSQSDSGNNNYLATIGKANFPPYGRDFPGGAPTGRYSNGKVPSDFIAEELGIKELVPPYLDPNLQISDLLTGVSFASGAAGYDPSSAIFAVSFSLSSIRFNYFETERNVMTLQDQLNLFKGYISKLKDAIGENATSTIISQSVYLVCAGSNDITNTYFLLPFTRFQYDISLYTDLLVNWASAFVQELYALGARRIGLISAPPCGCLPSQRILHGGLLRSCAEEENEASILFNDKLFSELSYLNQKLDESRIVYLDGSTSTTHFSIS
uniref:Uncharacterized protein n=1 Tax=Chenopodium quinoa TaxID=63459 RepID=A0A803MHQ9_CHEQI